MGMSIQDLSSKFKASPSRSEYLLAFLIIGVSLSSFFLGRISNSGQSDPIEHSAQLVTALSSTTSTSEPLVVARERMISTPQVSKTPTEKPQTQGAYVAAKTGTKYYLPWCGSVKRIKEENKVWFQTKEEAEKAGYAPASTCKGI